VISDFANRLRRWASGWPGVDAPIVVDALVLVGFVIARTTGTALADGIWLVTAMVAALRWPASGLGIAVAVAITPQQVRAGMTPGVALVAASAVGVAITAAADHVPRIALSPPMRLVIAGAAALGAALFLSLIHTQRAFDPGVAATATLRWTESAAGLGVLILGLRAMTHGSMRPLVIVLVGLTVALGVALVSVVAPTVLVGGPLHWLLSGVDSSRATGSFVSPNRLGTVAAVAVVVGGCHALAGPAMRRFWAAAFGLLAAVVLVLTFSRGALLGLVVAGAALIATRSRRASVLYIGAAAAAAFVLVPLLLGSRLAGGGTLQILLENDVGRFDAWLAGIRMIVEKPLFGFGFNAFAVVGAAHGATDGLQTAHFELIDLWAQAGVLAAAGFVMIVTGIVVGALRRKGDPWALAALGAVVVFVVASSFNVQSPFLNVVGPVWVVATFGLGAPLGPEAVDS
jgi:O-antigen ligase